MSTETERINIAANVRRLRRVQGLTQVALAERSGLCQSWISRLERRAENPSIETLQRLATGLRRRGPGLARQSMASEERGDERARMGLGLALPRPDAGPAPGAARVGGTRRRTTARPVSPRSGLLGRMTGLSRRGLAKTLNALEAARTDRQGAGWVRRCDPVPAAAGRSGVCAGLAPGTKREGGPKRWAVTRTGMGSAGRGASPRAGEPLPSADRCSGLVCARRTPKTPAAERAPRRVRQRPSPFCSPEPMAGRAVLSDEPPRARLGLELPRTDAGAALHSARARGARRRGGPLLALVDQTRRADRGRPAHGDAGPGGAGSARTGGAGASPGQGTVYTLAIGGRCTKVIPAEPPDPRDGGMKPPHQGRDAAGSMTPPGARNPRSRGVTPLSRKERPPDPVASEPPNRQRTGSEPSLCDDDVAHAPNLTANGQQNPGLVSDGSTRTPPELARCAEAGAATGKRSLEQRQACPDERPVERRGQTDDSGDSPCRPGLGRRCGQLAHAAPSPGEGVLR